MALIAGLADGTIDTLVSDHDPKSADVKRLPFGQAAEGVVGFETMLPLALAQVHAGKLELMTLLRALTSTPADLLRLPMGRLKEGVQADLVIFDRRNHGVSRKMIWSRARRTCHLTRSRFRGRFGRRWWQGSHFIPLPEGNAMRRVMRRGDRR